MKEDLSSGFATGFTTKLHQFEANQTKQLAQNRKLFTGTAKPVANPEDRSSFICPPVFIPSRWWLYKTY